MGVQAIVYILGRGWNWGPGLEGLFGAVSLLIVIVIAIWIFAKAVAWKSVEVVKEAKTCLEVGKDYVSEKTTSRFDHFIFKNPWGMSKSDIERLLGQELYFERQWPEHREYKPGSAIVILAGLRWTVFYQFPRRLWFSGGLDGVRLVETFETMPKASEQGRMLDAVIRDLDSIYGPENPSEMFGHAWSNSGRGFVTLEAFQFFTWSPWSESLGTQEAPAIIILLKPPLRSSCA